MFRNVYLCRGVVFISFFLRIIKTNRLNNNNLGFVPRKQGIMTLCTALGVLLVVVVHLRFCFILFS